MLTKPDTTLRRLIRRIPIPVFALAVGLLVGLSVWLVIDRIQTRALSEIFDEALENQLHQHARESLIRFGEYRSSFTLATKMLANHKRMAAYLDPIWWSEAQGQVKHYTSFAPLWLPRNYRWRADLTPSHLMLIDTKGGIQELYSPQQKALPKALDNDISLYVTESTRRAFLTTLNSLPYLIVSEPIEDNSEQHMGSLVILVPLDSHFLIASQQAVKDEQSVVAILDADAQTILSSSDRERIPQGTSTQWLRENYVITAQSFFDYDNSDLNMLFATLLPRSVFKETGQRVLDLERRQRLYGAGSIIFVFVLLFVIISGRINRLLRRLSVFSRRALDIQQDKPMRGNQLLILEEWIREFVRLVLKAREEMRERHASKIRETEELRSAIMATSLDCIITIDGQGEIIDYNTTSEQTFGYSRQSALGKDLASLVIANGSVMQFQEYLVACLAAENWSAEPKRFELFAKRQDGEEFPVELAIKPVLLESKLLFTVYIHNIEERLRQENEIRSLAAFPSESPIPVLRIDERGVILYANSASEDLMRYWRCDLMGNLPGYWRNQVAQVLRTGRSREIELNIGDSIYALMLAPILEFSYVNIYARDITETRRAEENARQRQNELVHVARLSTMGEMATGIAHELNQPLSAIVNFANGSVRRLKHNVGTQEDILAALEQIAAQASRAGAIIKRMRSLVTRQQPVREVVDLNSLVSEVGSLIAHEIRKQNIDLQYQLNQEALNVRVDPVQIEQVVLNLMRNASDALSECPADQRVLRVKTRVKSPESYLVEVTDNAKGIDEETMLQLFDAFFTTKSHGMGMGLAISRTIVEDHHGRISADSVPGEGTTFIIELPANTETSGNIAI